MHHDYTDCNLIYHRADAEKNRGYIGLWEKHCAERGLNCGLILYEDLCGEKSTEGSSAAPCAETAQPLPSFDTLLRLPAGSFVVNRSRDASLSLFCEEHEIPVYNGSRLVTLGNDKALACEYVRSLGLHVLQTEASPDRLDTPYPCVMKSADGHGGTEVFLLHDAKEEQAILREHPGKHWLYQELCDTPGKDLRVWLVGEKIVGAMLRSSDTDFRANYSLGAKAEPYQLNREETELVRTITSPLKIGHCGVDFLFHKGKLIFNEIEDTVGSRMLYRYTDVDVVRLYLEEILKQKKL